MRSDREGTLHVGLRLALTPNGGLGVWGFGGEGVSSEPIAVSSEEKAVISE